MLKKEYIPFLIGGFVLVAYFNIPILALALVGLAIAMYDFNLKENQERTVVVKEDYEDGI